MSESDTTDNMIVKNQGQFTIVYTAVTNKCLDIVQRILNLGIEVNIINNCTGFALLHVACINKDADMVKLLIDFKANLNIKVLDKMLNKKKKNKSTDRLFINKTSLLIAVHNYDVTITELLLENGADANEEPNILITALKQSMNIIYLEASTNIIKLLLKYNASTNCTDSCGNTPLHLAIDGDSAILDLLLEHNPHINAVNKMHKTPLHCVSVRGNYNLIEKFLKNHAHVNATDGDGNTALHLACQNCMLNAVKILLNYNADVNIQNHDGRTPLHAAVPYHHFNQAYIQIKIKVIEALLDHNANINIVDYDGNTPLALACLNGHNIVVDILLKHNADVCIKNSEDKTSLHLAIEDYQVDVFKILLSRVVDIKPLYNYKENKTLFHEIQADILCKCLKFISYVANFHPDNLNENEDIAEYIIIADEIETLFRIYEIMRIHIIKLKSAKINIHEQDINLVYKPQAFQLIWNFVVKEFDMENILSVSEMEEECYVEVKNLKHKKINGTTLYNLLTADIRDLTGFTRNEWIIQSLQSDGFDAGFPIYSDLIKTKVAQAIKRNELLEMAKKYFFSTSFYELPVICVEHIFYYFDLDDLKAFISVF